MGSGVGTVPSDANHVRPPSVARVGWFGSFPVTESLMGHDDPGTSKKPEI